MDERIELFELFLSDGSSSEADKDGLIWKDCLREGTFAMTPGPGGAIKDPFTVIADGDTDPKNKIITMSDIEDSFKERSFEHVTIPLNHKDKELDNTGFVKALRRVKKEIAGTPRTVLQAGLQFTEPDVKGKVERGTIPNVSSGIFTNFIRKADGKKFRAALKHVCLTNTPFINNLDPFPAIAASDGIDAADIDVEAYTFAEEEGESGNGKTTELVWNDTQSMNWRRDQIRSILEPQREEGDVPSPFLIFVEDIAEDSALVSQEGQGEVNRFIVPYSIEGNEVKLAPPIRWTEVRQAMVAASDDDPVYLNDLKLRLTDALESVVGKEASGYRVDDLTHDDRVKIVSKVTDAAWLARFYASDEETRISPVANWHKISEGKKFELSDKPAKPSVSKPLVGGSLAEARRKRASLMGR